MGYLSRAEAGGNTIFPQLGLSVRPEVGSALFWLTAKDDHDYDSRMFHMGCPVMHGHKWVLTKWVSGGIMALFFPTLRQRVLSSTVSYIHS
jgi:hypothetical protein